jgi:hypothetical protein
MLRCLASAILGFFLVAPDAALAEDCAPHCDYWHYYGPYDFSYIKPVCSAIRSVIARGIALRILSTHMRVADTGV